MIKKLLVANRGEIALRIMRTAKSMGIVTVAVYSEADKVAPHVLFADEAICIGPAPSRDSYLRMDKIIEAAIHSKCDAIHPGYGFLSENSDFVKLVHQQGLIFIGPPASAMEQMGSKIAAKQTATRIGVPLVPGTDSAIVSLDEAKKIALKIGFPLLIKASAGGGGKGMRLVKHEEELGEQMRQASSEALASFGDGAVFIEKYVVKPRHIEIQIFCDKFGNGLYLFERECSIQRRHQKIVEEAPSSCLTSEIRKKMGEDAIKLALACGYVGAGTVEFLVDDSLNYYFLEMNTRLQVEHTVTEMITGLDLVEMQIRVAEGHPLAISQQDLLINGHSIEVRVCAEDPKNHFFPSIGTLEEYEPPRGVHIRVDDSYTKGMEIPIHYDPMIGKLIVHGKDREDAIKKMLDAISKFRIKGVETTLPFCEFVLNHSDFRKGNFDTGFVEVYYEDYLNFKFASIEEEAACLFGLYGFLKERTIVHGFKNNGVNWVQNRK
ncbi:MAG: acetyl-CoA carboxylase biotin carboxylase subunit [Saprospiraceae bacterium]|nr:acetyl-CoA carboxylase biotin carboxylase subunit [Candidatus Vicinibacter affinis]MBK8641628.1 acetyl-CoA carboxylase biotin carboxylase subunit [Candidatus Vicinibacter affinis]